jgi:membrane-anchored glycerophosphoryl diester phosphodiesterase (GDPDase)
MNYELPSAPLSIGGVLDNAIRLYREVMRRCWVLALIYAVVVGGFTLGWMLVLTKVPGAYSKDPKQVLALLSSPVFLGGFLLAFVISFAAYGALMTAEIAVARGETVSAGKAIAAGIRRVPAMLLAGVIALLAILVGLIALLIPGIYVIGKLQLWLPAMFFEKASALESIKISWRLSRRRWWRGATILTVGFIMLYVFAIAFGLVAGIIGSAAHLDPIDRMVVNQSFSIVSNTIVFPMFVAVLVVMYHDFKLRSEGGDLAVRVGSLGKA